MTRPMIRIHNTEIDEVVDREMNDEEFVQYQIDVKNAEATKASQESMEAKKQEVLAKLGLTADEVAALLA